MKTYGGNEKSKILKEAGFSLFDVSTAELYENFLSKMNGPTGSYMRLANILCWEFVTIPYYIIVNGFFVIVNDDGYYGGFSLYAPVGDYEDTDALTGTLEFLEDLFDKLDEKLIFLQVKEWMRPFFDRIQGYEFDYLCDEGESDYLFDLSLLDKHQKKRAAHYEHKIKDFTEKWAPEITGYSESDYDELMRLVEEKYCSGGNCDRCTFGCMKLYFDRTIKYIDAMNGSIMVFKSDGRMIALVALSGGEDLLGFAMYTVDGLKGFTEYFYKYIVDNYSDKYEYMNIEEDMGIEGIRLHKKGIGPYTLSHNYHMTCKKHQPV